MRNQKQNAQSAAVNLRLDWCSYKAAKYAVENWHYSRTLPTPPLMKIGVWEDKKYIGCVIYGRGNARNLNKQYNLKKTEIAELVRVALGPHTTPTSKIVAVSIMIIKTQCPGLQLIASYSDIDQGHYGTIYQATNWVYVGWTKGGDYYTDKRGKKYHSRMLSESGRKKCYGIYRNVLKPSQLQRHKTAGRHKYLMPLTKEMRKQIEPLSKPYPKRGSSKEGVALPVQGKEGGSSPTEPLREVI